MLTAEERITYMSTGQYPNLSAISLLKHENGSFGDREFEMVCEEAAIINLLYFIASFC